jgi:hypothetical protein
MMLSAAMAAFGTSSHSGGAAGVECDEGEALKQR